MFRNVVLVWASLQFICTFHQIDGSRLNQSIGEIICKSFGEIQCPFDPYCVGKGLTCEYCPSGDERDCSWYSGKNWYGTCEIQNRFKYYHKSYDSCNGRNDCLTNKPIDEERCNEGTCFNKTFDGYYTSRPHKCPGANICVENEYCFEPCKDFLCPHET